MTKCSFPQSDLLTAICGRDMPALLGSILSIQNFLILFCIGSFRLDPNQNYEDLYGDIKTSKMPISQPRITAKNSITARNSAGNLESGRFDDCPFQISQRIPYFHKFIFL